MSQKDLVVFLIPLYLYLAFPLLPFFIPSPIFPFPIFTLPLFLSLLFPLFLFLHHLLPSTFPFLPPFPSLYRLGRQVDGRVKITHLSDGFVKNFKKLYSVGDLVKGKVLE